METPTEVAPSIPDPMNSSRSISAHGPFVPRIADPVLSLYAKILPPVGGDTLFTSLAAAYDALSDELKERIDACTATIV